MHCCRATGLAAAAHTAGVSLYLSLLLVQLLSTFFCGATCLVMVVLQVHEEDIMLVKGPSGAPERKPFDTRHECTEKEWFVVSSRGWPAWLLG